MNRKDIVLAVASGILMILIFPGFYLNELAWACLVPVLSASHRKEPSKGFLAGCITGTVFHCGLIYWVTVSMTIHGGLPFSLSLLLLIFFSIFLSIFIAVPVYLSCYVQKFMGWNFALTLPFLWTASEHIKTWFLTGFPWENLGYSQFQTLHIIQIADITGVYGISFLIVFINCAIFSLLQSLFSRKGIPLTETALCLVLLALTAGYGSKKLNDYNNPDGNRIKVAIIQPNIPQDKKWDPSFLDKTIKTFSRLTRQSASEHPDLVVWPESATPFFFQSEDTYKKAVENIVSKTGAYLLFGSPSWEADFNIRKFFNSAFLVSPENKIVGKYNKMHLVPYGEYVPLKDMFPFIHKMVVNIGEFSNGKQIINLQLPTCTFATLICYEIIFPDLTRRFVKKGAHFIINITNDAWFGETSASFQNVSMAVLRAVENRRFVVRAANTGISAFIDPAGSILKQTKLFTQAVLPDIIICREEKTFYTLYGDVFAFSCYAISLIFILMAWARKRGTGKNVK